MERLRESAPEFPNQAYSYRLHFNLLRRNRHRAGAAAEQLRAGRAPTLDPEIFFLSPVLVSSLQARHLPLPRQVAMGHDVFGYIILGSQEHHGPLLFLENFRSLTSEVEAQRFPSHRSAEGRALGVEASTGRTQPAASGASSAPTVRVGL